MSSESKKVEMEFIPYIIELGDLTKGLTQREEDQLKKLEGEGKVVHKWLWWDGRSPFNKYKSHGRNCPMWCYYSDSEENKIEDGYLRYLDDGNKEPWKFDKGMWEVSKGRCTIFNCIYKIGEKAHKLMVQGYVSDENNPGLDESKKRRRPILRVSFCWFYGLQDTVVPDAMTPFPKEISCALEEWYIKASSSSGDGKGHKTVSLPIGLVDFERGTIKTSNGEFRIARVGTPVKSKYQMPLGLPPSSWSGDGEKFLRIFKFDSGIKEDEKKIINKLLEVSGIPSK